MAKTKQRLYEGMYILSATLSDDARQKALDKITVGITERGGEVNKIFDQGRRKLAYEVNGRREGHYYVLFFTSSTQVMTELWRDYHINEDLVRFMTITAEAVPEKIEFKPLTNQ